MLLEINTGIPSKALLNSSSEGRAKLCLFSVSENIILLELSIKNISSTLLSNFSDLAIFLNLSGES